MRRQIERPGTVVLVGALDAIILHQTNCRSGGMGAGALHAGAAMAACWTCARDVGRAQIAAEAGALNLLTGVPLEAECHRPLCTRPTPDLAGVTANVAIAAGQTVTLTGLNPQGERFVIYATDGSFPGGACGGKLKNWLG